MPRTCCPPRVRLRSLFTTTRCMRSKICRFTKRSRSAPLALSFTAAREHVKARAEDLAQVRPEFGHCSNAITIVGRREWSRGLFLDRRAFLTSYDPTSDTIDHAILTRILQAAFTVCAGFN